MQHRAERGASFAPVLSCTGGVCESAFSFIPKEGDKALPKQRTDFLKYFSREKSIPEQNPRPKKSWHMLCKDFRPMQTNFKLNSANAGIAVALPLCCQLFFSLTFSSFGVSLNSRDGLNSNILEIRQSTHEQATLDNPVFDKRNWSGILSRPSEDCLRGFSRH